MMNHYEKKNLTVQEADILCNQAKELTKDMAIKPMIHCIDTKKAWNGEKMCNEVVEQKVCVIGYFHEEELTTARKLESLFGLVSSL